MRTIQNLNNNWYYKDVYEAGYESLQNLDGFEIIHLPHTNVELPYNYFDEKKYQIISCYKYPLNITEEYKDKLIFLHFEGVMAYAKVFLNGTLLGEHKGGYTPFDIRIDKEYKFGSESNIITVVVDSTEREEIPPFGGQIDYLTYGGIYREVSLGIYDEVFIKNIKVETTNVLEDKKDVNVKVYLENLNSHKGKAEFDIMISEKSGAQVYNTCLSKTITDENKVYEFDIKGLESIKLWAIDSPNLYDIKVRVITEQFDDERSDSFGFRQADFTPKGFFLNGERVKIRGLNRHQAYPYVGYAMPKRVQEKDAEILKNDLHLNLVRSSHYPQSRHFLNKCDELGLLVFEEIPGWQFIGNEEWKEIAKENVKEMVKRDWNHPSIILWGVRINESPDNDVLFEATNKIAHELDSTRQTGGVRCIPNSKLLEDVYTMNDFNHDGVQVPLRDQQVVTGLDHKVPYMVTEYNGHMYPTKRFDQEERQMEHSLRHLRIQNASYLDESVSGAIGWCAFDYNTHKDFGSGDRICYHGVMDMFRIHKFASYVYKSQVSPQVEPVLEPITFWARGERNIGGIIPLIVYTNCDYIEFKYGPFAPRRVYPDKTTYSGIPYAPVVIDNTVIKEEEAGSWGMTWEDVEIAGFYKDKAVITKKMSKNPLPTELEVKQDDYILTKEEKDATRITIRALDQYGNLLPFLDDIIKIEIEGPVRLQGPSEFTLKGGAAAFWIETQNQKGKANIKINSITFGIKTIRINII